jgi:hypothetical protein
LQVLFVKFHKIKGEKYIMPSKKPQFVIRTDQTTIEKIKFIANKNERSATQEIVFLIKQAIKNYESEKGEIQIEQDN